ncbi:hypothetical protein [Roseovarius sp. 2305UL8-3]|uniref:hypothetical protein n=1 Tax=Roseovarius conchicola TaxID=3121636 RepID=UPI00352964BF
MPELTFTPASFECLFDKFVESELNGCRLDKMLSGKIPDGTKCADYFFPNPGIIIELKTLNKNHGEHDFVLGLVEEGLANFGFPLSRKNDWLNSVAPLPQKVVRFVHGKVQNSIKNTVRKANKQVISSRILLGKKHDSILICANLNELLFGPLELLKYLAGHAMSRSTPAIDAILMISPGVQYSSVSHQVQHYAAPIYADGKQHLGDFLEPFIEKWLEFEAQSLGLYSDIEKVYEFDEDSKTARPIVAKT